MMRAWCLVMQDMPLIHSNFTRSVIIFTHLIQGRLVLITTSAWATRYETTLADP